jgi:hypothetical protein
VAYSVTRHGTAVHWSEGGIKISTYTLPELRKDIPRKPPPPLLAHPPLLIAEQPPGESAPLQVRFSPTGELKYRGAWRVRTQVHCIGVPLLLL